MLGPGVLTISLILITSLYSILSFTPSNVKFHHLKQSRFSEFSSKTKTFSQKNDRVVNKITRESEDEYFNSEVIALYIRFFV